MQPIYIKSFKVKENFNKRCMTSYILSANKNYASNDEVRCIINSYKNRFYIYVDKSIENYFNLYSGNWPKLENIISISQYLKLDGFTLIEFNSLISLINVINNPPEPYYHNDVYFRDLNDILQLILAKWDNWN
jgi:hypothetical protein